MALLRVRYQTIEFGEIDIHIRSLRDNLQFADDKGEARRLGISSATWPLFGVVWDAGQVLARIMWDYDIEGKKILEVGCGIGLSSLLLNHRRADITATDYHPEAGRFLRENVRLNKGTPIPFIRTAWEERGSGLGRFDLIIGSDLLYEEPHSWQLARFIHRRANPRCKVIIVDPGRGHHNRFCREMDALGYVHRQTRPETNDFLDSPFKGRVLWFNREK